jgi:hypothetical protein
MRRSEATNLIELLGYDPYDTAALILKDDEIEVRRRDGDGAGHVWYMEYPDVVPAATYHEIVAELKAVAPVPLGDIESLRFDWRGISAQASTGLKWTIPWDEE